MKYFVRSLKYFLWFILIFIIIMIVLITTTKGYNLTDLNRIFDPEVGLFKENSLWKILVFFAAVSGVYPLMAFSKKDVYINGTYEDNKEMIASVFNDRGYEVIEETPNMIKYRLRSKGTRFMRLYEDAVVLIKNNDFITLSGFRKDIIRIDSYITMVSKKEDE
ncbi:MAG: hypothetical protein WC140_02510 [Bacteroidales bacterium]